MRNGMTQMKAVVTVNRNHPEHTVDSIRSKHNRYLKNGGRSDGHQIFTDSEIEQIIGCLQAWS